MRLIGTVFKPGRWRHRHRRQKDQASAWLLRSATGPTVAKLMPMPEQDGLSG